MTCLDENVHMTSGPSISGTVEAEEAATPTGLTEALLAALLVSSSNLPEEEVQVPLGPPPGLEHIVLTSHYGPAKTEIQFKDDIADMPLPPGFEHLKQGEKDAIDCTADSTTDAGNSSSDSSSEDESQGSDVKRHFTPNFNAPWRTKDIKTRADPVDADGAPKMPPWRKKHDPATPPKIVNSNPEVDSESVKAQAPWRALKKDVPPAPKSCEPPPKEDIDSYVDYELPPKETAVQSDSEEETIIWVSTRRMPTR
jgi:hypothetical protein